MATPVADGIIVDSAGGRRYMIRLLLWVAAVVPRIAALHRQRVRLPGDDDRRDDPHQFVVDEDPLVDGAGRPLVGRGRR